MDPIHIIVGSQMGAAEAVADELAEELQTKGIEVTIHEAPNYDDIPQSNVTWLICTSTHGAGELPDNIRDFAAALNENKPDLCSIKYGVIGLGDKSYDTFCAAAHQFDQILCSLNAQSNGELLEINALDPDLPEDYALAWLPGWLGTL